MRIPHLILLLTISNLAMGQVYKPLTVDSKKDFKFRNEGKVIKWWDEQETVNSDMLVNNDTLTDIQFTKAKLRGDTLDIEIYQNDESHDHHYKIEIIRDKYKIDYDFSYPADTTDRRIQTLDFMLTLNTKTFKKGKTVKGYTEFKGKCIENCYDNIIIAKGYFKVTVE
jgi:hypothetical protein